jgi:hypothetical protein
VSGAPRGSIYGPYSGDRWYERRVMIAGLSGQQGASSWRSAHRKRQGPQVGCALTWGPSVGRVGLEPTTNGLKVLAQGMPGGRGWWAAVRNPQVRRRRIDTRSVERCQTPPRPLTQRSRIRVTVSSIAGGHEPILVHRHVKLLHMPGGPPTARPDS